MNVNVFNKSERTEAIAQIDRLIGNLKKLDEVMKRLAEIGFKVAKSEFDSAAFLGNKDVTVELVKIDDGYQIQANGKDVCYLEFGAGVYYNGNWDSYEGERPAGIDGIGEHDTINDSGVSKGIRQTWGYYDPPGSHNLVKTHGTPKVQAMYHAYKEMENRAQEVIREVFGK